MNLKNKPWDARLANWLVRPLVRTPITPNHLTTLRVLVGLLAVACFAIGGTTWLNVGGVLYAISAFIDHTDGELARLTGKGSAWGKMYDERSDTVIQALTFIGIGVGLRDCPLGLWVPVLGIFDGLAVGMIFVLLLKREADTGTAASDQPSLAGFEIEDMLYLMPLVAWLGGLPPLLVAAAIGAPLYALGVALSYRAMLRAKPQLKS